MWLAPDGRWPPVYDADDLARTIRALATAKDFDARFWHLGGPWPDVCQGDIIRLASSVPLIDENGDAIATDDCDYWLLIGNTCDFARDVGVVPFTQFVPLIGIGRPSERDLLQHRAYQHGRRFYVPAWPNGGGDHYFADFTRPVTVHKQVFGGAAKVVARMQYAAWVLLHSCLIRFLARDDGRHDPA